MTAQQSSTRAAATVTEVAAFCQLSRSRFYELVKARVFPEPVHNATTTRPIYTRKLIEKCLEIRHTGVGLDGRIVLFNQKRTTHMAPRRKHETALATKQESPHADLLAGLKSLGMLDVTDRQIEPIVRELFPNGREGHDLGELIRAVFLKLKQG